MKRVLKGNHAVAEGVKLCRVKVISAYPITPQTTIVEMLSEMCSKGDLKGKFIKVESEHSAMAAVVGSSSAGVRSFTATSSQGLLLMHEVLHWAAGARLPIVMANVNRAVGAGWNIWADQTDSFSQRDTGWIQFYCESNQEVLDSVIMAYRLAEQLSLPVMLTYDAFFLSHTSEIVDIPEQEKVDSFLPPWKPSVKVDINDPRMFGGIVGPDYYYEGRYVMYRDCLKALDLYPKICSFYHEVFGRNYDTIEEYRCEDAETIVVTLGTICSVTRIAVDKLRQKGERVGLMKVRMFRPIPVERWRAVLSRASRVIVIDRDLIAGEGGVLSMEVNAVLSAIKGDTIVFSAIAGLGGRDVTPQDVEGIVDCVHAKDSGDETPIFWGLKQ